MYPPFALAHIAVCDERVGGGDVDLKRVCNAQIDSQACGRQRGILGREAAAAIAQIDK